MFILERRVCFCITAILFVVISLQAIGAKAQTQVQATAKKVYLPLIANRPSESIEQQVVDLTNQERHNNGCFVDLTISPTLSRAAYEHSRDMALNNLFSHYGSDGSTLAIRATSAGYSYQKLAENIAAGYPTAASVMTTWMKSAGHSANILNCSLREIGIGFYYQPDDQANVRIDDSNPSKLGGPFRYYWTQDFGTAP